MILGDSVLSITFQQGHIILAQYIRPAAVFLNKNSYTGYTVKCTSNSKFTEITFVGVAPPGPTVVTYSTPSTYVSQLDCREAEKG